MACFSLGASALMAGMASAEEPQSPVDFSLSYTADVIGVVDGGLAQRGRVLDNLILSVDADLNELVGWRGATANITLLNNSGGMPNEDVGSLQGIDNIEVASQRLRLFEFWVEQAFGDASVRAGLYDLNSEFYANESAGMLLAPAFGIGSEIAATGPNGPSIFPSTALAVRYHHAFSNDRFLRAAMLNANASVFGDPDGVDTSFDNGALLIAEGGVEGARKIAFGAWRYTERQDDIRDVDLLGDPIQRAAYGAYVVLEQPLNDPEGAFATTAFLRAGASEGETTSFSGGWQAGVLVARVMPGRPDSAFSFGVNQALISEGYRQNQIDGGVPMAESEVQVEITYSDKLLPFLTIQPDLQWVRNPGGDRSIDDALIAGVRFNIEL